MFTILSLRGSLSVGFRRESTFFFFFNQIRDLKLGIESYFDFTVGSVIGV